MNTISTFRFLLYSFIVVLFSTPSILRGQDDFSFLKKMIQEDRSAVDAVILYPENVRAAMLEASLYPEVLVQLHALQNDYNKAFADLMTQYPKDEQEKYWNLIRYEGLVKKLTDGSRKTEEEISTILKDYPQEIHETALKFSREKYDELDKISKMEDAVNKEFYNLIKDYPQITQDAYITLVGLPEVLSIMQDNISLVVLVGDAYKKNPELVKQKADSVSLEVARQNAENTKEWTKTLEENPEAAAELKEAAKDYAKECGYDEEESARPEEKEIVEVYHYYEPYPYWFGYPWWYPHYWWYPYPYWYHWGFYFSDGGIVVFGLPSYYFVSWYFYYPIHHYYYPHLSDAYIHTHHYYGPRRVSNSITQAVDDWKKNQGEDLPPDLLKDDAQRVERLKEYGKFEEDYARHNLEKPDKTLSREDFFEKNENKYPQLNYPKWEVQTGYRDDVYEQNRQYPTKKEIENKTYERKWVYPEKKEPERKYYPNKQVPQQKQVEPQRKVYPQNNVQPQKKFVPKREVVPQKQPPQRQIQPKSNRIVKPKGSN